MKVVNRINIDTLLPKIVKEGGIEQIEWYMEDITFASKEVLQEIAMRLNPELREELRGFFRVYWLQEPLREIYKTI